MLIGRQRLPSCVPITPPADLKASQLKDYVWGVAMLADWSIRAPREMPGGLLNFNLDKKQVIVLHSRGFAHEIG